jgi:hypothetical protein
VRERTSKKKINGDKCWKTGERKWETKSVVIEIVEENSKQ